MGTRNFWVTVLALFFLTILAEMLFGQEAADLPPTLPEPTPAPVQLEPQKGESPVKKEEKSVLVKPGGCLPLMPPKIELGPVTKILYTDDLPDTKPRFHIGDVVEHKADGRRGLVIRTVGVKIVGEDPQKLYWRYVVQMGHQAIVVPKEYTSPYYPYHSRKEHEVVLYTDIEFWDWQICLPRPCLPGDILIPGPVQVDPAPARVKPKRPLFPLFRRRCR